MKEPNLLPIPPKMSWEPKKPWGYGAGEEAMLRIRELEGTIENLQSAVIGLSENLTKARVSQPCTNASCNCVERGPESDEVAGEVDCCVYCGEEGEFEDGLRCKQCQEDDEAEDEAFEEAAARFQRNRQ